MAIAISPGINAAPSDADV